jgi:hypothetical protein
MVRKRLSQVDDLSLGDIEVILQLLETPIYYLRTSGMYGESVDGADVVVEDFCDYSLAGYFV